MDKLTFSYWLAGLTDGEGCFLINRNTQWKKVYYYPRFAIHMRLDDISVLRQIQKLSGVGRVNIQYHSHRNPMATYQVDGVKNCSVIMNLLDGKLQSKKHCYHL